MSHKIQGARKQAVGGRSSPIKWRACGSQLRDRVGFVDGVETLQITHRGSGYTLSFHHEEKARPATLEEARARAELDLEQWREERRLRREQEAAATARQLRDRRAREERLARLIADLNAAGVEAREVFGAITLTDAAAEGLLARISG
ncbi:MAG TPA: hypothetical protein VGB85_26340 [Nannocystis sp.]|jgi:hypothetical protein